MKNILLSILVLLTLNQPVFSQCQSDDDQCRIGKLGCPQVLRNCTTIIGLRENKYLPPKDEASLENEAHYQDTIKETYTSEQLFGFCKSCVVSLSKSSSCINKALNKCRKSFH